MAISTNWGFLGALSGQEVTLSQFADVSGMAVVIDDPGKCKVVKTDDGASYPVTIRFESKDIKNVYNKVDVPEAYQLPDTTGKSIMTRLDVMVKITDDSDASYVRYVPMSGRIVFEIPNDDLITDTICQNFVHSTLSLCMTDAVSASQTQRITNHRFGVMRPSEL